LCNQSGHQQQADDHGDVQCSGELAHQVCIFQNIGHVVGTNTGKGGVQLSQQINAQDQQIELVLDQQTGCLTQGVLLSGSGGVLLGFVFVLGQLLQGQDRDGVGDDTDDDIDQSDDSPCGGIITEVCNKTEGNSLDDGAGGE